MNTCNFNFLKKYLLGLLSVLISIYVQATNYFVDGNSGSDNYSGLYYDTAFATISKADSIAGPGDSIIVATGSYNEVVNVTQGGNSSAFKVFYADTIGNYFLNSGTVNLEGGDYDYGFYIDSCSYIIIDGFRFNSHLINSLEINSSKASIDSILIRNCFFYNWNFNGAAIILNGNFSGMQVSNIEIDNCIFDGYGSANNTIISYGYSGSENNNSIKIYKNKFYDVDTAINFNGFNNEIEINSNDISSYSIGISFSGDNSNILVYNNMIYENFNGIEVSSGLNTINILNNSVVSSGTCLIFNADYTGIRIVNNILNMPGEGTACIVAAGNQNFTECNYNLFYSSVDIGQHNSLNYSNIESWRTAISDDANSMDTIPFTYSSSNLHILNNSPAINAGKTISIGTYGIDILTDFDEETRDGNPDIGADEISQLNGVYNIGIGQDFETISEAVESLERNGVSGPVTLLLTDPVYNETGVEIDSISGNSATNTILLKPDVGVDATINVLPPGATSNIGFYFREIDYFTIDGSNNGTNSQDLHFVAANDFDFLAIFSIAPSLGGNGANYNTLTNFTITGNNYGTDTHIGIYIVNNNSLSCDHNTIENIEIKNVGIGIAADGSSIPFQVDNKILYNKIGGTDISSYIREFGIRVLGNDSIKIIGNDVGQLSDISFINDLYGIFLENVINYEVSSNNVHDIVDVSGMLDKAPIGIYYYTDTLNPSMLIKNNIVQHITSAGSSLPSSTLNGISINAINTQNKGSIKLYNNTINACKDTIYSMTNPSYYHIGVYFNLPNDSIVDFINNSIQLSIGAVGGSEGDYGYCVYSNGPVFPFLNINNNNYYVSNYIMANIGSSDGMDYANLSEWQTFTNQDANSISLEPKYISVNDAHMASSSIFLDGIGQPLTDVPDDIDGELRDAVNPDIGADEFTGAPTLSGNIATDTTLTDTIIITDTVWIDNGYTVNIDPGTVFFVFDSDMGDTISIIVNGKLNINGAPGDTVRFLPYSTGYWEGIKYVSNSDPTSIVDHAYIETGYSVSNDAFGLTLIQADITVSNSIIIGNSAAVYTTMSNSIINNCEFLVDYGDGIWFDSDSSMVLNSSFLIPNSPINTSPRIFKNDSSVSIVDSCSFISLDSSFMNNAFVYYLNQGDTSVIMNSYFNNMTPIEMDSYGNGVTIIQNNRFVDPRIGALICNHDTAYILNNEFYISPTTGTINNLIHAYDQSIPAEGHACFYNNTVFNQSGINFNVLRTEYMSIGATIDCKNSIIWGFTADPISSGGVSARIDITYSNIQSYTGDSTGVIEIYPEFMDTISPIPDLNLSDSSVCVNIGKPDFTTDSLGGIMYDLLGNPRFNKRIDMGAYEGNGMPVPGNAAEFNGIDQYIEIADTSDLDLSGDFTLEAWIKPTLLNVQQQIIAKSNVDFSPAVYSLYITADNRLSLQLHDGTFNLLPSQTILEVNQWYHVAASRSGTDNYLYINGKLDTTNTITSYNQNNEPLTIGGFSDSQWFTGEIDEVRIWNVFHDLSQIETTINSVLVANEPGLVAYYDFDRKSDTILPELTVNGFDGALNNMGDSSWVGSLAIITPIVKSATQIIDTAFTANWSLVPSASYYYIDVSDEPTFSSGMILDSVFVGSNNYYRVSGGSIYPTSTYYYRVRSDGNKLSKSSDIMEVNTVNSITIDLGSVESFCAGDSLTIDAGAGYTAYAWSNGDITQTTVVYTADVYTVTVTDAMGRQAADSKNIVVNPLPNVNLGADINQCEGTVTLDAGAFNSYEWSTSEITSTLLVTTSGEYIVTVTDNELCQASDTIIVNIYSNPVPDLGDDIAICEGGTTILDAGVFQSYLWSDLSTNQTLTVGGAGKYSITVTENGCTGIDSITITTTPALEVNDVATICYGESYNGHTISGIYSDTFSDVNGCDSIVHLTLTVLPEIFTIEDVTLCSGASYKGYSTAGTYYDTLTAANGCDSIIEINIIESTEIIITHYIDICEGESYEGHTVSGTYDDSAIASVGCDSINRIVLTVYPITTTVEDISICFGESYRGHTISGTYFETLTSITGCDSIIQTNLTVNPPPIYEISNDVKIINGNSTQLSVDASGSYTYYWTPASGLSNAAISNPIANPTITTTYFVEIENSFGCIIIDSIKVTVVETADKNQEIPLNKGWNIISLNIQPSSNNMLDIIQPLIDNNTLVKVMNESGLSIVEIGNVWNNFIGEFKSSEGYLLKVNNDVTLTIEGIEFSEDITIGLLRGWNIISYPQKTAKPGEEILSSLINRKILVKVQDESGLSMEQIMPLGWINNIGYFNPGEGYKVKVNNLTALVYGNKTLKSVSLGSQNLIADESYFTPVWSGNGLDHMNLYSNEIKINEMDIQPGDEIAVFDGEQCVGVVKFKNYKNGYIPIIVSKDDPTTEEIDGYISGNPIKFKVWDASEQTEVTNPEVLFIDNSANKFTELGTSIFSLKATSVTTNTKQNAINITCLGDAFPNPFTQETSINYSLHIKSEVVISIFNLLGEKVITLIDNTLPAGNYQIIWNGIDEEGINVPSGIYLYRMETNDYTQTKPLIIQ